MRCEGVADDGWHGNGAVGGVALGRAELGPAIAGADQLAVDANLLAQKVDPVDGEAEALALAQASASGEDDERPVPVGHGVDERLDGRD